MERSVALAFALLAVWAAWLYGLQGLAAGALPPAVSAWVPDVGLALLLALAARVSSGDLMGVALAVALGRIAVSIDPPAAVLAGCLGLAALSGTLRRGIELQGPLVRTLLCGLGALAFPGWLAVVHGRSAMGEGVLAAGALAGWGPAGGAPQWAGGEVLRGAIATALVALLFAPALARLPGLSPLYRRRRWLRAASRR